MLTLFKGALSDFCDAAWNEHFINVAVLEPLVADLCDTFREGSYLKNAELPKILVTDREMPWRKHRSGLGGALPDVPSALFWSVYFS